MGTLYLVRHGQASFGADDYDNLSPLGIQQSVRLGNYWRAKGLKFDAALVGTLKRQTQTLAGILEGMDADSATHEAASVGVNFPDGPPLGKLAPSGGSAAHAVASVGAISSWPGLNEYDSKAVIEAIQTQPLKKPDTPELYRQHFRILRDGLTQWMNGVVSPKGMPSYAVFLQGVVSALDHVRNQHGGNVLIVSSGGPISTAVGHVLGTSPETTIELNLRIRNTSITEFSFTPKRHMVVTYNTLPHLDSQEHATWVTYS
jgi:broad specificity phosphatase PhoE